MVGGMRTTIPKITQDMLADMVGITRSHVSSFLNQFKKLASFNTKAQATPQYRPPRLAVSQFADFAQVQSPAASYSNPPT